MDNLPIPNMRSSWVAALINTLIIFFLYYLFLFGVLLEEYREHFISGSFNKSKEKLVVWVDVPRYFYAAGSATVHVHVKNESKNLFNDVKVYLITQPDPKSPTLLIPNVFNEDVYSSLVEFPVIEPLSISTGRVSFITQSNTSITSVLIKVGEDDPEQLSAIPEIRFAESSPKALQIDFLEHVLLPPWSNGFILALVLLSTFLVRTDPEEKKEEKIFISGYKINPVWGSEFIKDYTRSSFLICIMVLITIIVYLLLGFVDGYTAPPFVGIALFTWLIITERSRIPKAHLRSLSPVIIFLGFVFIVLAVILMFLAPLNFISLAGRILWVLLGLEGLVAFIWYYGRQFSSENKYLASDKDTQKLDVPVNNNPSFSQSKKNRQKK
ncbi:MAG: hypothetical protein IH589_14635 [Anaerolineales bacterium]|nr:hypothetical protein [Anaerolineales bacterium]